MCAAWLEWKKSLCVREQRFPNTALALGGRLALITCVCTSFLRVIQHDSVRKQEQPLKHIFSAMLLGLEGERSISPWLWRTFQNRPRIPGLPCSPCSPSLPGVGSSAMRGSGVPPPPTWALHPTQSSNHCKHGSICQQKDGACYFCRCCFCYFSVISAIITAGFKLPVHGKAD